MCSYLNAKIVNLDYYGEKFGKERSVASEKK